MLRRLTDSSREDDHFVSKIKSKILKFKIFLESMVDKKFKHKLNLIKSQIYNKNTIVNIVNHNRILI